MLALAVFGAHIRGLPKEDQDDMYELTKAFIGAESEEERESAADAMFEILDQAKTTTQVLELSEDPNLLKKWTSFVSQKIKDLRAKANMTQEDLAEKTGLTQSHISRLESGQHSPSAVTLQKLALSLGVPLAVLDPNALDEQS